jgi:GH24 family phage-related lysozyme (muramidase)
MIKKLAVLFLLGGGGWLIWRALTTVDEEGYSNATGLLPDVDGFIKAAYGMASGDIGLEESNSEMNISTMYLALLKQMENGIKKGWDSSKKKWFVHLDSQAIPTIAYGHVVKPGELFTQGLTEAEAIGLLITDIEEHANYVRQKVKPLLSQGQFDAAVDFVYNTGPGSLMGTGKFSKKYGINPMQAFNQGGISAGFAEMAKHYDVLASRPAYKASARGLLNRKAMQQGMAFSGVYRLL